MVFVNWILLCVQYVCHCVSYMLGTNSREVKNGNFWLLNSIINANKYTGTSCFIDPLGSQKPQQTLSGSLGELFGTGVTIPWPHQHCQALAVSAHVTPAAGIMSQQHVTAKFRLAFRQYCSQIQVCEPERERQRHGEKQME